MPMRSAPTSPTTTAAMGPANQSLVVRHHDAGKHAGTAGRGAARPDAGEPGPECGRLAGREMSRLVRVEWQTKGRALTFEHRLREAERERIDGLREIERVHGELEKVPFRAPVQGLAQALGKPLDLLAQAPEYKPLAEHRCGPALGGHRQAPPLRPRQRREALLAAEYCSELGQSRLDPGADALADFVDPGVGDPVERAGALLAAGDEALGEESREVLGDVLLRGAERLGQLADRGLVAVAQEVENSQPGRVGEGSEAAGDQLGGVWASAGLF